MSEQIKKLYTYVGPVAGSGSRRLEIEAVQPDKATLQQHIRIRIRMDLRQDDFLLGAEQADAFLASIAEHYLASAKIGRSAAPDLASFGFQVGDHVRLKGHNRPLVVADVGVDAEMARSFGKVRCIWLRDDGSPCSMEFPPELLEPVYTVVPRLTIKDDDAVFDYGFCPKCGAQGITRERRPNGNDTCAKGHTYPSREATDGPTASPIHE